MRTIKLTIEYDGTAFKGWQRQTARDEHPRRTEGKNHRTVQGEIEKALKTIFKQDITLTGSGRTDSGVHAMAQVAHFKIRSAMSTAEMANALNANLPEDIAIIDVDEAAPGFHAQYSVKSKIYRYTILNRKARGARERHFCLHYPYKLNVRAMREEAKVLVGRHDFRSFTAADPAKRKKGIKETTIRTVKRIAIAKKSDFIIIDIEANGFLYKMVRNIVGTLLEIGTGKLEKGSIKKILAQKDRGAASATAKPHGLALLEVKYR